MVVYKSIKNVKWNANTNHRLNLDSVDKRNAFVSNHFDTNKPIQASINRDGYLFGDITLSGSVDFNYLMTDIDGVREFWFVNDVEVVSATANRFNLQLDTFSTSFYLSTGLTEGLASLVRRGTYSKTYGTNGLLNITDLRHPVINDDPELETLRNKVIKTNTNIIRESDTTKYDKFVLQQDGDTSYTYTYGADCFNLLNLMSKYDGKFYYLLLTANINDYYDGKVVGFTSTLKPNSEVMTPPDNPTKSAVLYGQTPPNTKQTKSVFYDVANTIVYEDDKQTVIPTLQMDVSKSNTAFRVIPLFRGDWLEINSGSPLWKYRQSILPYSSTAYLPKELVLGIIATPHPLFIPSVVDITADAPDVGDGGYALYGTIKEDGNGYLIPNIFSANFNTTTEFKIDDYDPDTHIVCVAYSLPSSQLTNMLWKWEDYQVDLPTLKDGVFSVETEPKTLTNKATHYEMYLEGKSVKLYNEFIWNGESVNTKQLKLESNVSTQPHMTYWNIFINTGYYTNEVGEFSTQLSTSGSYNIPSGSQAYLNFLQNHQTAYYTGFNTARNSLISQVAQEGVSGLTAFKTSATALGLSQSVNGVVSSSVKYTNAVMTLQAQATDLQRQPLNVKDSNLSDTIIDNVRNLQRVYSGTEGTKLVSGKENAVPYITIQKKQLSDNELFVYAYHYHQFGYIANRLEEITTGFLNVRKDFNYWEIENMENVLYDLNPTIRDDIAKVFHKGITIWNDEKKMYQYLQTNNLDNVQPKVEVKDGEKGK